MCTVYLHLYRGSHKDSLGGRQRWFGTLPGEVAKVPAVVTSQAQFVNRAAAAIPPSDWVRCLSRSLHVDLGLPISGTRMLGCIAREAVTLNYKMRD